MKICVICSILSENTYICKEYDTYYKILVTLYSKYKFPRQSKRYYNLHITKNSIKYNPYIVYTLKDYKNIKNDGNYKFTTER